MRGSEREGLREGGDEERELEVDNCSCFTDRGGLLIPQNGAQGES